MKPGKAIQILNYQLTGPACLSNPDLKEATRLSIEALIRHQGRHLLTFSGMQELLPGETKV